MELRKDEVENTNTAQVEAIHNATGSSESHLIISEKSDNQNTENVDTLAELSKKVRVLSTISTDHPSNTRSDTVRSESEGGEHYSSHGSLSDSRSKHHQASPPPPPRQWNPIPPPFLPTAIRPLNSRSADTK